MHLLGHGTKQTMDSYFIKPSTSGSYLETLGIHHTKKSGPLYLEPYLETRAIDSDTLFVDNHGKLLEDYHLEPSNPELIFIPYDENKMDSITKDIYFPLYNKLSSISFDISKQTEVENELNHLVDKLNPKFDACNLKNVIFKKRLVNILKIYRNYLIVWNLILK